MPKRKQLPVDRESKYKEHLPEHLQERYEKGLSDPYLLHVREEIALMDLRIKMLIENIDHQVLGEEDILEDLKSEFPDLDEKVAEKVAHRVRGWLPDAFIDYRTFRRLESLVDKYDNAMLNRQIRKADGALRELHQVIREGRKSGDIWREIQDVSDQRRRLVDQEQKRLTQAAQLIAVEKVVLLLEVALESLRGAVEKYVGDKEIQNYIFVEAEEIYGELTGSDPGDRATYQIGLDEKG